MAAFKLSNSTRVALVDAADFERLSSYTWRLSKLTRRSTQYVVRDVRVGKTTVKFLLHRDVLGVAKGIQVDHINRDGLDNRRSNLRAATGHQNQGNRAVRFDSATQYKGVTWDADRARWKAVIRGRRIGRFASKEDAARAYNDAALKEFGEFALLNVIR